MWNVVPLDPAMSLVVGGERNSRPTQKRRDRRYQRENERDDGEDEPEVDRPRIPAVHAKSVAVGADARAT
jgi:hypothetical protein